MFWHHIIPSALLLVTQGKDGVMARWQGKNLYFPATPVVSVDTTGAGDAFVAGLLAALAAEGCPPVSRHSHPSSNRPSAVVRLPRQQKVP